MAKPAAVNLGDTFKPPGSAVSRNLTASRVQRPVHTCVHGHTRCGFFLRAWLALAPSRE